jgi:hypothetical protein
MVIIEETRCASCDVGPEILNIEIKMCLKALNHNGNPQQNILYLII